MSARERLDACYQHAVLKHLSDSAMTNQTLRKRLKMPEQHCRGMNTAIQR
jgi:ATP-dependent DNA helicase RecG